MLERRVGLPVRKATVVRVQVRLALPVQIGRRGIGRRSPHQFAAQVHRHELTRPLQAVNPMRRDEYLVSEPPDASVIDGEADRPSVVVEVEVLDMNVGAIGRADEAFLKVLRASQHAALSLMEPTVVIGPC